MKKTLMILIVAMLVAAPAQAKTDASQLPLRAQTNLYREAGDILLNPFRWGWDSQGIHDTSLCKRTQTGPRVRDCLTDDHEGRFVERRGHAQPEHSPYTIQDGN